MCDLLAECLFSLLPVSVPVFQFWHLVWLSTLSLSLETSSNKHSFELNILVIHGWHTSLFENIASFCQTLIGGSNHWLTRFAPWANSKWSVGQQNYFIQFGRHGFTSVSAVMRFFRISNAKCHHMGWKDLLGYMYLLNPGWHICDNLVRSYVM